jgi:hypothetical protein
MNGAAGHRSRATASNENAALIMSRAALPAIPVCDAARYIGRAAAQLLVPR